MSPSREKGRVFCRARGTKGDVALQRATESNVLYRKKRNGESWREERSAVGEVEKHGRIARDRREERKLKEGKKERENCGVSVRGTSAEGGLRRKTRGKQRKGRGKQKERERESTSDIAYLPADSLEIYIIKSDAK